jgi:hypothetical protein
LNLFGFLGNSLDKKTKRRRRYNEIIEFWETLTGLGKDEVREKLARADYDRREKGLLETIILAHSLFFLSGKLVKEVVREMKKLADIEAKWGSPAQIEQTGDGVIWYYYFYKTNVGMNNGFFDISIKRESEWWLGSIIADKEGNIIKVSKY